MAVETTFPSLIKDKLFCVSKGMFFTFLLLYWAVVVRYANAVVHTEIIQIGEMGVEQTEDFSGTPVVTFFAVALGGNDFDNENYVVSFGEPDAEGGCYQSLVDICEGNVTFGSGWESTVMHYPTPESDQALYIRRSLNLLDPDECFPESIMRSETESMVTLSGSLILSSFTDCPEDTTDMFHQMKEYKFEITYDKSTFEITGLTYDLIQFTYSTSVKRIIPSPEYFLIFEVEVVTEMLVDADSAGNNTDTVIPPFLHDPVIRKTSGMGEGLITTQYTNCAETSGAICTQLVYIFVKDRFDVSWETNLTGGMEIEATLESNFTSYSTSVVLRAEFDVDPKSELGLSERTYDVFITSETNFYDSLELYIHNIDNSNDLLINGTTCVNILRLDREKLQVNSIILYSEDPDNEANTYLTVLYYPGKIALGSYHVDTEWSSKFCFKFSTLIVGSHTGLVPYYLQVDYGTEVDLQFDFIQEGSTSTESTTGSEVIPVDATTGLFKLQVQKRNLFTNIEGSLGNPTSEISEPQTLYYSCPYAHQCYHYGYCVPCNGWDVDDVSTGAWVFFGLMIALVAIVLIALCAWPGDYKTISGKKA